MNLVPDPIANFEMCLYSYRGYYCRRWEHDFYARKKYLQYVETKNEEVRRNLDDHNRKIGQEEQKR